MLHNNGDLKKHSLSNIRFNIVRHKGLLDICADSLHNNGLLFFIFLSGGIRKHQYKRDILRHYDNHGK